MKRTIAAVLAGAIVAVGLAGVAKAETFLGSRTVAYKSEQDVIAVPGKQRFGSVRICVKRHAVHFRDLDVVYGNGGKDDLPVRQVIPAGECTRWIDLRGGRRNIRRIVLRYDTWGDAGPRAVIEAWAR